MNFTPDGKMPGESQCSPRQIQHYLGPISGPLLDRIDLHMESPAVKFQEITSTRSGKLWRRSGIESWQPGGVSNVGGNTTSLVENMTAQTVTGVTNTLAGCWKLDETTGDFAADSSGRGNNGTMYPGGGSQRRAMILPSDELSIQMVGALVGAGALPGVCWRGVDHLHP
jgi:Magnesium chelatase, subunit ChlI